MSDYATNRLFLVYGRTEAESSSARRTNRAAQSALFDFAPRDPRACPACAGIDDCTCQASGAEALTLETVPFDHEAFKARRLDDAR